MSSVGDLNIRVRRPSTPGANGQILFNNNGVEGANINFTYNVSTSTANVPTLNLSSSLYTQFITCYSNMTVEGQLNMLGTLPSVIWVQTGAAANTGQYQMVGQANGSWTFNTQFDNGTIGNDVLTVNRTSVNVSSIYLGNPIDKPVINISGTIAANQSPSVNNVTRTFTGLAAFKTPTSTSGNATLTIDNSLILTFNETGRYQFELFLIFYETTGSTGGFQFDLGANTAITANIGYSVYGWGGGTTVNPTTAITANNTATSAAAAATSATSPSFIRAQGYFQVTTAGYIGLRWAQASAVAANVTNLKEGSYFIANKIG
jgi:hypothetical protein